MPEPAVLALVPDDALSARVGFARTASVAFSERGGSCGEGEDVFEASASPNKHTTMRAPDAILESLLTA
jgi:hypothetical protein